MENLFHTIRMRCRSNSFKRRGRELLHYLCIQKNLFIDHHKKKIICVLIILILIYSKKVRLFFSKILYSRRKNRKEDNSSIKSPSSIRQRTKPILLGPTKVIFVGQTGAGKSSLISELYGVNLNTGMGGCTKAITKVFEGNHFQIYDSPGVHNQIFGNQDSFLEFKDYDIIAVVYETSLKSIDRLVKGLLRFQTNKQRLYIRSKCDNFGPSQKQTLGQELEKDRNLLIQWGYEDDVLIFTTTANKQFQKSDANKELREYIRRKNLCDCI